MTKEMYEQLKSDTYKKVMAEYPRQLTRRKIMLEYRNTSFPTFASTCLEEIELRIWCLILKRAVQDEQLDAVLYEKELAEDHAAPAVLTAVEEAMLHEAKLGRKRLNATLLAFKSGGPSAIKECLLSKESDLYMVSKMLKIEISWLRSMAGDGGAQMLHQKGAEALPDAEHEVTVQKAHAALEHILKMPIMDFVEKEVSGDIKSIFEILHSLNKRARRRPWAQARPRIG